MCGASFDRCEAAGDFAEAFYEVFLNSSPEIAPLFAKTDFKKQRRAFEGHRDVDDPTSREALERVGHSHAKSKLDIRPDLYDLWLGQPLRNSEANGPRVDATGGTGVAGTHGTRHRLDYVPLLTPVVLTEGGLPEAAILVAAG